MLDISNDKSKVYTLSTFLDPNFSSVWTTFDFVTGNVVGNRYLDPPTFSPNQFIEHNNFLLIIFNGNLAPIAKYDKTTDTFTDYWEHSGSIYASISGISGNK